MSVIAKTGQILPDDIPANPMQTYKNDGWQGMGDWLGTGTIAARLKVYRPFEEAREFARSLKLKTVIDWHSFCQGDIPEKGTLPDNIPRKPDQTYKDKGWQGFGDWLGTGAIANFQRVYRPFEEAREFARSLELENQNEWFLFCKGQRPEKGTRPDDIPTCPNQTYKNNGWQGMGDWLGTKRK